MEDEKLEVPLRLSTQLTPEVRQKSESLSAGFSYTTDTWEVILRMVGEIETLQKSFPEADFRYLSGGYAICLIPEAQLEALTESEQIIYIEQPKRLYTQVTEGIRASCILPLQQEITPTSEWNGRGVFVAVIDSGIDYFHEDFRNADGSTRIRFLWDDGIEYTKAEIDAALQTNSREEAYRIVPSRDVSGHGTHVAGIAAGNGRASQGRYRGVAYESELIIAKLGNARAGGFPKTTQLMEAVEYVKTKAQAENKPVAINISFGNNYGSHSGSSLLESYLSQVANQWKMSIAVGMGNEGEKALHKEGRLGENQRSDIEMTIGAFESSVNVQYWKYYQDAVEVMLLAPDGSEIIRITAEEGAQKSNKILEATWQNTRIYCFVGAPSPYSVLQEYYFSFLPEGDYIDSGIWRIRSFAKRIKDGRFALWLPASAVSSEETFFLNSSKDSTLTVPASAQNIISVGAYDSRRNQFASFSGRGYTWAAERIKPDLVAPGVDITSTAVGGGYQTRSGTSMATPFVTGTAALILQWGIVRGNDSFAYGEKLKAYLLRGAKPLFQEGMPSEKTGWGKLCVDASIPKSTLSDEKGSSGQ